MISCTALTPATGRLYGNSIGPMSSRRCGNAWRSWRSPKSLSRPPKTLEELRRDADEGLLAWAEDNPALFRELDSEQEKLAAEIIVRYPAIYGPATKGLDAAPYVVALGVTHREHNPDKSLEYAVVANKVDNINRPDLLDVCEDTEYSLDYIASIRMLRYLGMRVPCQKGSLIDLEGLWEGMEITEEDIEEIKYKTKWFPV